MIFLGNVSVWDVYRNSSYKSCDFCGGVLCHENWDADKVFPEVRETKTAVIWKVSACFFFLFLSFFFFRTCSDVGGVYLRQEACPNMARAAEIPPVGALICATTSLQPILQRPLIIKPGKP